MTAPIPPTPPDVCPACGCTSYLFSETLALFPCGYARELLDGEWCVPDGVAVWDCSRAFDAAIQKDAEVKGLQAMREADREWIEKLESDAVTLRAQLEQATARENELITRAEYAESQLLEGHKQLTRYGIPEESDSGAVLWIAYRIVILFERWGKKWEAAIDLRDAPLAELIEVRKELEQARAERVQMKDALMAWQIADANDRGEDVLHAMEAMGAEHIYFSGDVELIVWARRLRDTALKGG